MTIGKIKSSSTKLLFNRSNYLKKFTNRFPHQDHFESTKEFEQRDFCRNDRGFDKSSSRVGISGRKGIRNTRETLVTWKFHGWPMLERIVASGKLAMPLNNSSNIPTLSVSCYTIWQKRFINLTLDDWEYLLADIVSLSYIPRHRHFHLLSLINKWKSRTESRWTFLRYTVH